MAKYLEELAAAIVNTEKNTEITDGLKTARKDALVSLAKIMTTYGAYGYMENLINDICTIKLYWIMKATTKRQLSDILKPSEIYYSGNEFIPQRPLYHVEQEEMIMWSLASLKAPLSEKATDRYFALCKKYFPEFEV